MGQSLCQELPQAGEIFSRADEILGYPLSEICFEGPKEKLDATEHSQPALFVSSMAALELLKKDSPDIVERCAMAAGLSLGEYTALAFSGALSFEDGLRLVRQRGLAMQQAADMTPSGMVSVLGLDRQKVEELCQRSRMDGEILQIANLLCPGNIAVSGHRASCEQAVADAEAMGAMRAVPLAVAGAFHTEIMQPAVEKLGEALSAVEFQNPRIPVVSNVDAALHDSAGDYSELLKKQVCSPVLWEDCMRSMLDQGCDSFYEIGTGRVLRGLLKRVDRKANCVGVPD